MSNVKAQSSIEFPSSNDQIKETFWYFVIWHLFDICLPARSRFGEGRDFEIWI
jgi:hypothetical protein